MKSKKILFLFLLLGIQLSLYASCSPNEKSSPTDNQEKKNKENTDVTVYITTANRAFDLVKKTTTLKSGSSMSPTTITLQPEIKYQNMDGFGAAVTGSTCFNLSLMPPQKRSQFLKETFSPTDGFGLSYIRISIGCSDFSLSEYTCCDTKGIENFNLTMEENKYIIPILKEILAINPTLKIIGSPWTCPKWMKVNNLTEKKPYDSWTSGQLNPAYYQDYAIYFAKWLQAFKDNGINIYAITPQNEPLNRKNSASLYMGWKEASNFIKTALGPTLHSKGFSDVKIYAFDHNYNYDNMADQKGYPINIYKDEEASKYLAGAAYHDYGGTREELNIVHAQAPDKDLLFTETSIGTWNNGQDLTKSLIRDMNNVALGTVNNWCKGVIVWNLMLDNDRAPNRPGGCRTCYGAVDISNSDYTTITRNSHYYIIAHMSSVVKPGAVRIGNSGQPGENLTYATFQNTDGSYAVVISNNGSTDQDIHINAEGNNISYKIPAKSITSFQWK